ncbi:MAG: alpha/beta hydrolase [Rhodoglobus sp.]
MSDSRTPVVFIHGLWLHSSSWQPWVELFHENGYEPITPGWPGEAATVEEARANPDAVAGKSLTEVVDYMKSVIAGLERQPIIIGHSFGGLITELLMGEGLGVAGVAIDPAQIKGVLPLPLAQLRAGFPGLGNPANIHKAVSLTSEEFRFGFGNAVSQEESDALYNAWNIPSPAKPLFEVAAGNFNPHAANKVDTHNDARGPLLLIAGGKDHTAPEVTTKSAFKLYRHSTAVTEFTDFEDRGHSLAIDAGWKDVANSVLAWLTAQGL